MVIHLEKPNLVFLIGKNVDEHRYLFEGRADQLLVHCISDSKAIADIDSELRESWESFSSQNAIIYRELLIHFVVDISNDSIDLEMFDKLEQSVRTNIPPFQYYSLRFFTYFQEMGSQTRKNLSIINRSSQLLEKFSHIFLMSDFDSKNLSVLAVDSMGVIYNSLLLINNFNFSFPQTKTPFISLGSQSIGVNELYLRYKSKLLYIEILKQKFDNEFKDDFKISYNEKSLFTRLIKKINERISDKLRCFEQFPKPYSVHNINEGVDISKFESLREAENHFYSVILLQYEFKDIIKQNLSDEDKKHFVEEQAKKFYDEFLSDLVEEVNKNKIGKQFAYAAIHDMTYASLKQELAQISKEKKGLENKISDSYDSDIRSNPRFIIEKPQKKGVFKGLFKGKASLDVSKVVFELLKQGIYQPKIEFLTLELKEQMIEELLTYYESNLNRGEQFEEEFNQLIKFYQSEIIRKYQSGNENATVLELLEFLISNQVENQTNSLLDLNLEIDYIRSHYNDSMTEVSYEALIDSGFKVLTYPRHLEALFKQINAFNNFDLSNKVDELVDEYVDSALQLEKIGVRLNNGSYLDARSETYIVGNKGSKVLEKLDKKQGDVANTFKTIKGDDINEFAIKPFINIKIEDLLVMRDYEE